MTGTRNAAGSLVLATCRILAPCTPTCCVSRSTARASVCFFLGINRAHTRVCVTHIIQRTHARIHRRVCVRLRERVRVAYESALARSRTRESLFIVAIRAASLSERYGTLWRTPINQSDSRGSLLIPRYIARLKSKSTYPCDFAYYCRRDFSRRYGSRNIYRTRY